MMVTSLGSEAVPRRETYRDASSPLSRESGVSIRIRLGGEVRRGHRHSRAPKLVVLRLLRLVLDPPVSEWPGSRVAEGLSDQTNGRKSEGEYSGSPDQREDQVLCRGVAVVVAAA